MRISTFKFKDMHSSERSTNKSMNWQQFVYWCVVVKMELSQFPNLSIYWSLYVSTLTFGYELWVMAKRTRAQLQAAKSTENNLCLCVNVVISGLCPSEIFNCFVRIRLIIHQRSFVNLSLLNLYIYVGRIIIFIICMIRLVHIMPWSMIRPFCYKPLHSISKRYLLLLKMIMNSATSDGSRPHLTLQLKTPAQK